MPSATRRVVSLRLLLLLPLFSLSYTYSQSIQPDAVSLLAFKSKADLDNSLLYNLQEPYDYCQWQGAKCAQGGRVIRLSLPSFRLRGTFPPNTLSNLDQLRVLNLQNNSLSGPLPDLSPLFNLKSLSLSHNSFSASFPPSILSLHRLTILDLSFNNLSGPLPRELPLLTRLSSLKLQSNHFNGTVPDLNQTFLNSFNVSGNDLSGVIPVTPTLSRFGASSFSSNPGLCGEIINRACKDRSPFFDSNSSTSSSSPLGQSAQADGGGGAAEVVVVSPPSDHNQRKRLNGVVLGATVAVSLLAIALVVTFFVILFKRPTGAQPSKGEHVISKLKHAEEIRVIEEQHRQQDQRNEQQLEQVVAVTPKPQDRKSGCLVFCQGGEVVDGSSELFSLEQLMRASAELLGRGTVGTTYKAVLDNRLAVAVKRLDASKTWVTSGEAFERHMEEVGGTRHPNLVPLVAYFQAKGERLVVYEYQPNGSVFNLIHGSRSARAKPLHWTSCLKIAEDVAQGLAHIQQTSKLVHGNLKSSNVLLGADFEARITDYCLAILADTSSVEDPDSVACKAPETRKSSRRPTAKSDVYAFGVLLLELLTGKHPSQHPFLAPADMLDWVRAMRDDDSEDYNQLGMLTEVASVCSLTSPEQRPAMWQVLKMIQEIKENVLVENKAAPEHW